MRSLSLLTLGLCYYLPLVVADRTSNVHNTPTVCNTEPVATGTAVAQKRVRRGHDGHTRVETPSNILWGRDLLKRSGVVTYDANCNNAPPANSGYQPSNGFPTMKSVLQQAYADAVTLADAAANIGENSLAFTHYFGGASTDVQYTHFKNMMSAITASTSQYFSIQFECSGTAPDCASGDSVAVTDATAGGPTDQKVINICTSFWTAASTRFLLYDSAKPAGVPYRDISSSGWCGKDKQGNSRRNCQFYANAGTSILHELTHLDSLGNQAGLEAPTEGNDIGRHGTDDAQPGCEFLGARKYLTQYQADSSNTSPDYNAESYAAAATELYFMNLCSITEIRPLVAGGGTGAASAPATTTQGANITPAPTISCSLQNEDPDQGINTDYCVCSGSTFPVLSVGATATGPGASCAYTSLPSASTINPTANLPVITSNCQVCSVGFDSEQCTTLPNCIPTSAPASTAAATTTSASPPPVCSAGFYGTDTSCGGKCNGAKANCECSEAGYETFNEACTCTCG